MLIGSAVDIGGTIAASIVLTAIAIAVMSAPGRSPAELQTNLYSQTSFLVGGLALGLLFSSIGGLVAARLARRRELMHAAITGAICVVLGLLLSAIAAGQFVPRWYAILGEVLALPFALLGGAMGRAMNRRAPAA